MLLQQHSSTAWASDEIMHEDRSLEVTAVLSNWMPGMSGTTVVKAGSGGKTLTRDAAEQDVEARCITIFNSSSRAAYALLK